MAVTPDPTPSARDRIDLLDWRRRVFALYHAIRREPDPADGWELWRRTRDDLFATHPQSPLPPAARCGFAGLPYFDHDPTYRVLATVEPAVPEHHEIANSDGTTYGFTRIATLGFALGGVAARLEAYWLDGYGGGLFVPFRDVTSGDGSYGGGRYLLDTVKGADLGSEDGRLVLDFNLAYNPSCAYDPRWVCPLSPPANHMDVAVTAGERMPGS